MENPDPSLINKFCFDQTAVIKIRWASADQHTDLSSVSGASLCCIQTHRRQRAAAAAAVAVDSSCSCQPSLHKCSCIFLHSSGCSSWGGNNFSLLGSDKAPHWAAVKDSDWCVLVQALISCISMFGLQNESMSSQLEDGSTGSNPETEFKTETQNICFSCLHISSFSSDAGSLSVTLFTLKHLSRCWLDCDEMWFRHS